ncbi:MAG: IMP dehydrogenase [Candidatus Altiarchaeota archaeon]|nr:IMP dehydrogenase [Candidatus Altiarchaeota archaeon]
MNIRRGLGFDDVLLVPKKFPLGSRKDIDISSLLTKKIKLHIPLISSNMMNVTESRMAIEMARHGGLGLIHRFMTLEEEVEKVKAVKRAENTVIEKPYTIKRTATVGQVRDLMKTLKVGGLLVEENKKLVGIVTRRDLLFTEPTELVEDIMTPQTELVTAPLKTSVDEVKKIWKKYKVEKIPLVDGDVIKGLIVVKDLINQENYPYATKDKKGRLRVGASVGVKDHLERATALVDAGVDIICVDVAHGHTDMSLRAVRELRDELGDKVQIIAGNIATASGAKDLISAGVDSLKIGIGSGSICTTRIVAGAGVPQITAIMDAYSIAKKEGIPVISDGGIKSSGDIVKALAAGANTVMVGGLLAGTYESPGTSVFRNGKKYKVYSGMASVGTNINKRIREGSDIESDFTDYAAEGIEAMIPYRGTVSEMLSQLIGGLRSGMSYSGSRSISELSAKAEFIRVNSIKEGLLKDLTMT